MKQTVLVIKRDKFRPALGQDIKQIRPRTKILTLLERENLIVKHRRGIVRKGTYVVTVNGQPVLQKDWNRLVAAGDLVGVAFIPAGGGGSNIGNIIGAILVAALAYFTFGLSLAASVAWGAAAYAVLTLVNPPSINAPTEKGRDAASPNYTLSAQNNSARLMEAIPVLYGKFRCWPDLAAQPYVENRDNVQYLYQLLCITQGKIDAASLEIKIEDNDAATFTEVQYELVQPFQKPTLFPDNVVSSDAISNVELLPTDDPAHNVAGPVVVNGPGTQVNFIAVDLSYPVGIYEVDSKGNYQSSSISHTFEYQAIDDEGDPLGAWQILHTETLTLSTNYAQLRTHKISVPAGRYQVRGLRTNGVANNRTQGKLIWTAVRGYILGTRDYGNVTLLAIAMKASNTLNGNIARRINVIAQRVLPTWDPVNGWGPEVVTRNPMWAACDAIRNTSYSIGLGTSRINMPEVYTLAQLYDTRGDEFNGVFDGRIQFWEALTKICRVGRAIPIHYGGVIDIVRNEPKTIPRAFFTPRNIIAGTWNTTYKFAKSDTPNYITGQFIDGTTWERSSVDAVLPGTIAVKAHEQEWFGITNRDQAWRESITMAAQNRDQRRITTFDVPIEGLTSRYMDLVSVSYDMAGWGQSGYIVSYNATTKRAILSTDVEFVVGETNVIGIRKKNGELAGPYTVTPGSAPNEVILTISNPDSAALYISDGVRKEWTLFQFGQMGMISQLALVTSMKPKRGQTATLTVVNYADSVYTAETGGTVPPPGPISNLPKPPSAPIINYVRVENTMVAGMQKIVASAASGASFYEYRGKLSTDSDWTYFGIYADPTINVNLAPGEWTIQVRAIGSMTGPWETWTGTIDGLAIPVPIPLLVVSTSQFGAFQLEILHPPAMRDVIERAEVWISVDNILGNAFKYIDLTYPDNKTIVSNLLPTAERWAWVRYVDRVGRVGDWYNGGVGVYCTPENDPTLLQAYLEGQIDAGYLAPGLIEEITEDVASGIVGEVIDQVMGDAVGSDILDAKWFAGNDTGSIFVGSLSISSVINEGDYKQAKRTEAVVAQVNDVSAAVRTIQEVVITDFEAMAQLVNTVAVQVGNQEAVIQETSQAVISLDEGIRTTYQLKAQARSDGRIVQAGIALGAAIGANGTPRSEILLMADTIAFLTTLNGALHAPFIFNTVTDTAVLNTAFIGNATIGSGKFIDWLVSDTVGPGGVPVLRINFRTGEIQLNPAMTGTGRMTINNQVVAVYDGAGTLRVKLGNLA